MAGVPQMQEQFAARVPQRLEPAPLPSVRPSVLPSLRITPTYSDPVLPSLSTTELRSGFTNIVTLSPTCSAVRVQPSLISTFGAVISMVQRPSGSSPSDTPSILIEACGLIQRNCVIVPSIFTTRVLSNAAVE